MGFFRFLVGLIASLAWQQEAMADEGGVSFWLPGNFGSLAAAPAEPGLSLPLVYYHSWADASASASFVRGGRITVGVEGRADLLFISPNFVFSSPVAGGQASVGLGGAFGRVKTGVDGTLNGPNGITLSGGETDSRVGISDLYPTASLKWNSEAHNFMAYAMGGVPLGAYEKGRLANMGTNHWSLDGGGGYTFFDKVYEFSAVFGFTYNFENPSTAYGNGVDAHLDLATSAFLSERFHVGLVGYAYNQLTGDRGSGAVLGDFKSRVVAVGPQAGLFFNVGERKWYGNLKGFHEFAARNRPEGWNLWLTLAIPLSGAKRGQESH